MFWYTPLKLSSIGYKWVDVENCSWRSGNNQSVGSSLPAVSGFVVVSGYDLEIGYFQK